MYVKVLEKIPLEKIDGAKKILDEVKSEGYRHLVRYSGTENKLRLLVEGKEEKKAKELLNKLKEFFKSKLS